MNKEVLIKKWLDHDLNSKELEAFKKLEDYEDLVRLSSSIERFEVPDYNRDKELNTILQKINSQKSVSVKWLKPLLRVASVLVICFGIYFYTTNLDTTVNTLAAQKMSVELPDDSKVQLNADSKLVYNKNSWSKKRDIKLDGEAYFKVAKGSTFNVITETGIVTVLGTQFNVKHRDNYFEVICFEGSVGVKHNNQEDILKPSDRFVLLEGKHRLSDSESATQPYWINQQSYFKSIPYKYVLKELERQFNVTIESKDSSANELFTGSFNHDDIELALKSVTLPLNLKYQFIDDATIVLSRD